MKFGTIGAGAVALGRPWRLAMVVLRGRHGPKALAGKVADLGYGAGRDLVDFGNLWVPAGRHGPGIAVGRQKVSTQGRNSTSSDQALRGWRRIST